MPCVSLLVAVSPPDDSEDSPSAYDVPAEHLPLLLPSELPEDQRKTVPKTAKIETCLREAQADDALNEIRRQRRILYSVYQFKKLNVSGTGNKPNTRVRAVFDAVNVKIRRQAERYRAAYKALATLDPNGQWSLRLRELADGDIRGPGRETGEARNSYFQPSWIWLTARPSKTTTDSETPSASATSASLTDADTTLASKEFDETMRIEWSKSKARLARWEEEAKLVVEEMRRVLEYLNWKKGWWYEQGARRVSSASAPVLSGLIAYAAKQASLLGALAQDCVEVWLPALWRLGLMPDWTRRYAVKRSLGKSHCGQQLVQPTTPPTSISTNLSPSPHIPSTPNAVIVADTPPTDPPSPTLLSSGSPLVSSNLSSSLSKIASDLNQPLVGELDGDDDESGELCSDHEEEWEDVEAGENYRQEEADGIFVNDLEDM
ncbi:hypothetical protein EYR36_001849 [Pleurotus pulmonarius]|nr:hypothetical protein EYR36_001849 [Pleurotus pulmonarius]